MTPSSADIAVIGGGPAGAAAARLLGGWGRRVVLIARRSTRRALAESLPPSCTKLFDQLGVRRAVDAAGFIRATGNTVQWAGRQRTVELFEPGAFGYQVLRDAFDNLLLDRAEASGAHIQRAAAVTDVRRESNDEWRLTYRGDAGDTELHARWVLDCSGRSGVVARRDWRRAVPSARTIALAAVWERHDSWPIENETHTLVESYADGWAWSVPASRSQRYVTVMLDPTVTRIPSRKALERAYRDQLDRTTMLRILVEGASMVGAPWGCDASLYTAERAWDDRVLLVGDAGSFVDPLSSFGVKKALASAWLAAVAVHTALSDAAMTSPALDLFARRERAMFEHLQRQSAALSRDAAGAHASSYWSARGESRIPEEDGELDVAKLREDARVLQAFSELRQRPSTQLRPTHSLAFVDRAIVRGNRIVLEPHLSAPSFETPVRYCRGIDLVLVTQLSEGHREVPSLFDAYNRAAPPAPLPDFIGALSTLIGFGALSFA